ncbi:MAG: hypothetical protein M3Q82_03985 [Actinomycetota bacterium]|nr:hypothetical protein [Actinomycetota bacterium]
MAWIVDLDQRIRRWTGRRGHGDGVCLREGRDLQRRVEQLAGSLGGRVGVDAVLADLDREAVVSDVPARVASYGFRWDDDDFVDAQWWPQGITTSADASDTDDIHGRRVVVVAWYAKRVNGFTQGVRLSFVDITDESAPRYRHVLLVEPRRHRLTRKVSMRPVAVHAGGIVWYGPSMLVADTRGGLRTFEIDDICRVDGADGWRGYRYVLPQRTSYRAVNDRGFLPFKFSFVSLDRTGEAHQLIAGEYGREGTKPRVVRFKFDAARAALAMEGGAARPLEILLDQLPHMQGATVVGGTYYVSTSRGSRTPGSLWVGRPGEEVRECRGVLAIGPEDLTYWPQRDELWNCSEYPNHRFVYGVPRGRLHT